MLIRILLKILECLPPQISKHMVGVAVNAVLKKYAKIQVEGYENIESAEKPVIFISNHLSNADGLVLNKVLEKEDATFVSGVKLSNNSFTRLGVLAVKTTPIVPNSPDKDGIKKIVGILKSGNSIVVFPEGTRSRNGSMIQAKSGILLLQRLSKATVIPIGLSGTEMLMPINDENMGKEKFHQAVVTVKIGEPIQVPNKEKEETKKEYEERVLNQLMISIAALLPEKYRGVYGTYMD